MILDPLELVSCRDSVSAAPLPIATLGAPSHERAAASPQLRSWRQRLLDLFEEAREFPELRELVNANPECTTLGGWRSKTESVLEAVGLQWEDEPAGYTFGDPPAP